MPIVPAKFILPLGSGEILCHHDAPLRVSGGGCRDGPSGASPLQRRRCQTWIQKRGVMIFLPADVNGRNVWGGTPLHSLCRYGHLKAQALNMREIALMFVMHGAGYTCILVNSQLNN